MGIEDLVGAFAASQGRVEKAPDSLEQKYLKKLVQKVEWHRQHGESTSDAIEKAFMLHDWDAGMPQDGRRYEYLDFLKKDFYKAELDAEADAQSGLKKAA